MRKIRTRINVPEGYEDTVSEFGARYDGRMKSWYVPEDVTISIFNNFIPLTVELVPSSNWGNNVRSEYSSEWDNIRRRTYQLAGYKCEVCGKTGDKSKGENFVEAHEVWSYSSVDKVQKLQSLICLCPKCHKVKHFGLALINKEDDLVTKHLLKINGWKEKDVNKYINEAFYMFNLRSQIDWELDLSLLSNFTQKETELV